jgi:hypothetical protein
MPSLYKQRRHLPLGRCISTARRLAPSLISAKVPRASQWHQIPYDGLCYSSYCCSMLAINLRSLLGADGAHWPNSDFLPPGLQISCLPPTGTRFDMDFVPPPLIPFLDICNQFVSAVRHHIGGRPFAIFTSPIFCLPAFFTGKLPASQWHQIPQDWTNANWDCGLWMGNSKLDL